MNQNPYLSLILPAYNERRSIAATLADIGEYFHSRQLSYEIVVAADGNDGTRELVSALAQHDSHLKVIGHCERSGKGRGVREAIAVCAGEIVGYADADNKVDIREFEKVEPALREGYEVVFGSRALSDSVIERRQPWYRRVGACGFSVFMHTAVGLWGIHDTQCGFKFFLRDAAIRIFREQQIDGYMFDVEILFLAHQMGFRMKEIPISWRDDGDSRLDLVSGNIRNVKDILRIRKWGKRRLNRVNAGHEIRVK